MNDYEIVDLANGVAVQRLMIHYLPSLPRYAQFEIAGAIATLEPSRHRSGVPTDAVCSRVMLTHLGWGWSVLIRTVWRQGHLFPPAATHTRAYAYLDDDGRYAGSEAAVALTFNVWLQSVPGL